MPAQRSRMRAVDYDDPCWFFFTSGTTGRSKAAVLTHGQMAFVVTNHLADLMPGTTENDASLVVAPLSHGAGVHQLVQTARGVPTILLPSERFDIDEAFRLIEAHRVTNIFTVPTILKMMVEHPAIDRFDHSSLRYIIYAGAPMYREDQKAALKKLGKVLVQYFGLGEVTGNITVLPPELHDPEDGPHARIGTCGFARTGMQVSIQGDDGRELKPLETGEICVIGPAVFAGYYDNPEANAKAFRDGWFRTGDLGHMDEEGFVYITGRASDMYISGGSNIYPREVEEKILTHPAIGEVAVLGVPDAVWGEVGIAVCVAREGATAVSEAEMAAFLAPKVPRYKMPKRFFFWDALPKSGYGKVPKRLVRDELEARGLLDLTAKADRAEMRSIAQPGPPAPRTHPVGGSARPRLLLYAASRPAAAGSRAPRLCRGRFCRRHAAHQERRARPVRLCDAGAVQDRRERGVLQRHLSPPRHHAAQDGGDDAGLARRRAFLSLPRAVDRGRRTHQWRPYPARGNRGRRAFRSRCVRHRWRGVCGRAGPRDQFQTVRACCPCDHRRQDNQPRLRAAAAAEPGFRRRAGSVLPRARDFSRPAAWRRRQHHRRAFYRWPQRRAVRHRTGRPSGTIAAGAGGTLEAELDVALVDYLGGLAEGRLMRGDNPVLMTMELVLEVMGEGSS